MGSLTVAAVEAADDLELCGTCGRGDSLVRQIRDKGAQVVVDFTRPDVVFDHARAILESGAHPVIGTSGLSVAEVESLQGDCERLQRGGVVAANFAVGAVLMMRFAALAAEFFEDCEIVEGHHPAKLDAPSGTARATAAAIAAARGVTALSTGRGAGDSRGEVIGEVAVHSMRMEGLVAEQKVIFGGPGETLSLQHRTLDRQAFMPGVLLACRRAPELTELVTSLECLLFRRRA
jgi:4-hydroxy-tetrahydrodipicolinate reductase